MKQAQMDYKKGSIKIEDVPSPQIRDNGILVQTAYSLISIGTEKSTLDFARSGYLKKAQKRPDLKAKVFETMKKNGIISTLKVVMNQLDLPDKLGYSCSGFVIKKGNNVNNINIGDRVACAGVGFASHSEINYIPKNLFTKIPDNVDLSDAAYIAVGAIALQSVRNANVRIGEKVGVIGLGLLGLITVQLLQSAGCKVIGFDIQESKVKLSQQLGIDKAVNSTDYDILEVTTEFTKGYGLDAVIITASTKSNQPMIDAGKICRDKGRVVVVGDIQTSFPRNVYYEKELELIISRSYGPGRYDKTYEENGIDYPYGYIRWTEQRNMGAFLELLSSNKINLKGITTHVFNIDDADQAYSLIEESNNKEVVGVLFKYDIKNMTKVNEELDSLKTLNPRKKGKESQKNIGIIGSGSFATTTLFPILFKKNRVNPVIIASQSGTSANAIAKKYHFQHVTSDIHKVFEDSTVNKVFILTRNSSHASLVIEALEKKKDVFVEKPPTVTLSELNKLKQVVINNPDQLFYVDYNRRYSKWSSLTLEYLKKRTSPIMINYRINAGVLPNNHWVYDEAEGASRYISELCHFVDYIYFLINSPIEKTWVNMINSENRSINPLENVMFQMKFKDGSIGNVIYSTIGNSYFNKEYIEIMTSGYTIINKDFKYVEILKNNRKNVKKSYMQIEKGHDEIVNAFLNDDVPTGDMLYAFEVILKAKQLLE